jgi:hypothetical protein
MSSNTKSAYRRGHFLGEIDTEIVGRHHYPAALQPGEHVNLEREPENPHDKNAIRVENGHFKMAGYYYSVIY